MARQFQLDPMRGFDPSKEIAPPPPPSRIRPPPRPADWDDALHDYDEVGDVNILGVSFDVDWDYLFARLDFTKGKWWLIVRDADANGDERIRVQELPNSIINAVLEDFVDLCDDFDRARLERTWLKRMFRRRDEKSYRFGKVPWREEQPPPESPNPQLELL
jgi:hypothetical protein